MSRQELLFGMVASSLGGATYLGPAFGFPRGALLGAVLGAAVALWAYAYSRKPRSPTPEPHMPNAKPQPPKPDYNHPSIQPYAQRVAALAHSPKPNEFADAVVRLVFKGVEVKLQSLGIGGELGAMAAAAVEPVVEGATDQLAGGTGQPDASAVDAAYQDLQSTIGSIQDLFGKLAQQLQQRGKQS